MNWYRTVVRDGQIVSCEPVEPNVALSGKADVFYVEAENADVAAKVALLMAARRRRAKPARRNHTASSEPERSPVAAASRLELLEEVARVWKESETQAQFVKWLISEISKLKGPQLAVDPYAPQSSLSGASL